MTDYLYYWQRHNADLAAGPIYKLNQNSLTMVKIQPGDDVWTFGLAAAATYALIARFTVMEVGENAPRSVDAIKYGRYYFRSNPDLTNFLDQARRNVEAVVRSLSIRCDGEILGQCFQGRAAVRTLTMGDRKCLIDYVSKI